MATGEVDQKVLAHLAQRALYYNPILAENFHQILGLSLMLSPKLARANELRKTPISPGAKYLSLYQEILWLSKEGLAITETLILPYCSDPDCPVECRVMAARLMATFYHIFSLYHNKPPLSQLRHHDMPENSVFGQSWLSSRMNAPPESGVEEKSFITNPWSPSGTPQPVRAYAPNMTPTQPPGLENPILEQYNPPVSAATFLLNAMEWSPEVKKLFEWTIGLAEKFLPGWHPLRLSVVLEYATFLYEQLGHYDASQQLCKRAIRAVFSERAKGLTNIIQQDSSPLVDDLADLAQKGEAKLANGSDRADSKRSFSRTPQRVISPPLYPPPTRELPALPDQQGDAMRVKEPSTPAHHTSYSSPGGVSLGPYMQPNGLGITTLSGINDTPTRGAVSIGSPKKLMNDDSVIRDTYDQPALQEKISKKSRASTKSSKSGKRRTEGTGTEKERKRRAMERAEEELMRKRSGTSEANTVIHAL